MVSDSLEITMPPQITVLDTTLRDGAQCDSNNRHRSWTTIGRSVSIVEDSVQALSASLELSLLRRPPA
jgi:hypothetical protein